MLERLIRLIDAAKFIPSGTLDLEFYGGSFQGHTTLAELWQCDRRTSKRTLAAFRTAGITADMASVNEAQRSHRLTISIPLERNKRAQLTSGLVDAVVGKLVTSAAVRFVHMAATSQVSTVTQAARELGVSRGRLAADVERLVDLGLVKRSHEGPFVATRVSRSGYKPVANQCSDNVPPDVPKVSPPIEEQKRSSQSLVTDSPSRAKTTRGNSQGISEEQEAMIAELAQRIGGPIGEALRSTPTRRQSNLVLAILADAINSGWSISLAGFAITESHGGQDLDDVREVWGLVAYRLRTLVVETEGLDPHLIGWRARDWGNRRTSPTDREHDQSKRQRQRTAGTAVTGGPRRYAESLARLRDMRGDAR